MRSASGFCSRELFHQSVFSGKNCLVIKSIHFLSLGETGAERGSAAARASLLPVVVFGRVVQAAGAVADFRGFGSVALLVPCTGTFRICTSLLAVTLLMVTLSPVDSNAGDDSTT